MPWAFEAEELERQTAVTGFSERCDEEHIGFTGVWEETWCARARLEWQAERYRVWLREQGCSREQAAAMTVRLLMAREPDGPAHSNFSNLHLIH